MGCAVVGGSSEQEEGDSALRNYSHGSLVAPVLALNYFTREHNARYFALVPEKPTK